LAWARDGDDLRHGETHRSGDRNAFRHAILKDIEAGASGGQFHRDVGRPMVEAARHGEHAIAIASAQRIDLRADESRLALRGLEFRQQFLRSAQYRDLHEGFGLQFGRELLREYRVDGGRPKLAIFHQRDV
jgi:hypothetical protein